MIVDAHAHVWHASPDYPSPGNTIMGPLSEVAIELLLEYMDEEAVDRAVLVQPVYPGDDNNYVSSCAARHPNRFVAVCVVRPDHPDAADRLEYWVRHRRCRGLRLRPRLGNVEEAVFGEPDSYPLWERARALGTVVNLLADLKHVRAIDQLATRFPDVPILIDHMAYPNPGGLQDNSFRDLLNLKRHANVHVKVSGYYYFSQATYPYLDCSDLFRAFYDAFGPARLLWGSDFPHCLLRSGYRRQLLLHSRAYEYLKPAELAMIMGRNALNLYWPDLPQPSGPATPTKLIRA